MSTFTKSLKYRRCEEIFYRHYPYFYDAEHRYQDLVRGLVTPQSAVLDLGCGRENLAAAQLAVAQRLFGIDVSLSDLACNTMLSQPVAANGEILPFAPASFDVIVSQWVLEHLADPQQVFSEIARLLRPGGHAIVFTTNAHNYISLLGRLVPEYAHRALLHVLLKRPARETFPTFFRANTRRALKSIAREVNLRLEHIDFVGNPFYLAFSPQLFRIAVLYEHLTDCPMLKTFKLYMLAVLRKP